MWKTIPPLAKIKLRRTVLALCAAASIALTAYSGSAFASCWASNPNGTRSCSEYINHGGSFEYLCEDNPGDCEDLGYTKVARPIHRLPEMRVEPRRAESHPEGEAAGSAKAEPRAKDFAPAHREAHTSAIPTPAHRERHREERRPLHSMPGVEYQVATWLSLALALCGILLLPTADRARLRRIIGRIAWAVSLIFLFMIAVFGTGPKRRRQRYY